MTLDTTPPLAAIEPSSPHPASTWLCDAPRGVFDSETAAESAAAGSVIDQIDRTLDLLDEASAGLATRPIDETDLTVIVPVYNERQTLPTVLSRMAQVMPQGCQLIIVDDGSTDGTTQWLSGLPPRPQRKVITRRRNHGKGSAVRIAVRHSVGSVVAIQDADLEYDPADLMRAVWPILDGNAEVVFGSRYLQRSVDRSRLHRLGNWILTQFSNAFTGLRLTDMETCHKAFDGDLIRSMKLRECRFGFEPEVTAKVARRDARIFEIPTAYQRRSYRDGKKIRWRDAFDAVRCILRYR
jgi:glycosyltransferase involved in cell wall biosynthesis